MRGYLLIKAAEIFQFKCRRVYFIPISDSLITIAALISFIQVPSKGRYK
jgi:hypothetical protein